VSAPLVIARRDSDGAIQLPRKPPWIASLTLAMTPWKILLPSSCPAQRGRGTASSRWKGRRPHRSLYCRTPPPPPFGWSPPHCVRGRIKQNRSRDALTRPSSAHHDDAKGKLASRHRNREAERRKAHANHVRASARLRGLCGRRARLSALTLAALATGYHPDGSAPEPGFRDAAAARCFAGKPRRCVALSTLRADRSLCRSTGDPEPPGSGWQIRRAGTAARSASTACLSGKAPYGERGVAL
jgi:hypothetical protein